MTPLLVETIKMPILYAGKNCLSQLRYWFFLTLNFGVTIPHLFIFAKSWILNLPALESSICSNSPIYRCFCITRRTSLENRDDGLTMHSFFLLISLLYKVVKRFDSMFNAGNSFTHFFYSYFLKPNFIATSLKHCLHSIIL